MSRSKMTVCTVAASSCFRPSELKLSNSLRISSRVLILRLLRSSNTRLFFGQAATVTLPVLRIHTFSVAERPLVSEYPAEPLHRGVSLMMARNA